MTATLLILHILEDIARIFTYPCLANACKRTPFPVPISSTLHPASSEAMRDSEKISRSVIDNKENPSKLSAQRPAATLAHIFDVHTAIVSITPSPNLQTTNYIYIYIYIHI
jgi:hypothetical protein